MFMFMFLIAGVWIRGLGSRSGFVKVLEFFVFSVWLLRKVWEIGNLTFGFGGWEMMRSCQLGE